MNAFRTVQWAALTVVVAFASVSYAQVQSTDDQIKALREQIRQLDQKLRVLERSQELKEEAATAAAKAAPRITANDGRVEIASADGAHSLRLRGLVQGDFRAYDAANDPNNTFLLRRARLILEGRFNKIFNYVIQPEFAGSVQILDAYVNASFSPSVQLRVGKFKTPVGLEQLQSDPVAFFNERSVATGLTPNRDTGLQIHGELLEHRLNYAVGVFNGVPDGGNNSAGGSDFDDSKVFAARIFGTPFVNDKEAVLSGIGFGLAASIGDFETVSGRSANYRTDGQQSFFTYLTSATAAADNVVAVGRGLVYSPQGYYYRGPIGLLAEYVVSSIEVRRGSGRIADVKNHGYNLSFGYVLTGEESTYRGVSPKNNFNPSAGTWGAFELVARMAGLDIDDTVFTGPPMLRLANPNVSATEVTTYGLGLNWYLNKSVRAGFNVFQNEFKLAPGAAPAADALISDDETTFMSRLQLSF